MVDNETALKSFETACYTFEGASMVYEETSILLEAASEVSKLPQRCQGRSKGISGNLIHALGNLKGNGI